MLQYEAVVQELNPRVKELTKVAAPPGVLQPKGQVRVAETTTQAHVRGHYSKQHRSRQKDDTPIIEQGRLEEEVQGKPDTATTVQHQRDDKQTPGCR